MSDLSRFYGPSRRQYDDALAEIRRGRKTSHWIWYIFPQIFGLGSSTTSEYYAIRSLQEAKDFAADPVLGARLTEISSALLELENADIHSVMGYPDDLKLFSSMTLFSLAAPENPVFKQVLDRYYGGRLDENTLRMLKMR